MYLEQLWEINMNNKGQALVMFIMLLPIMIIMFAFIVDLGLLSIEKRNINNNVKEVLEYAKEDKNNDLENNINNILYKNLGNDINTKININSDTISVSVSKNYNTLFKVLGKKYYEIKVKYILKENEIIKG